MVQQGSLNAVDLAQNRFLTQVDAMSILTVRVTYDGDGKVLYVGNAAPGAVDNAPVWLIRQMVYDGSGNLTAVLFAAGRATFDNLWSDRASLNYA